MRNADVTICWSGRVIVQAQKNRSAKTIRYKNETRCLDRREEDTESNWSNPSDPFSTEAGPHYQKLKLFKDGSISTTT